MLIELKVNEKLTHLAGRRFAQSILRSMYSDAFMDSGEVTIKFPEHIQCVAYTFADEIIHEICGYLVVYLDLDIGPNHYVIDGSPKAREMFRKVLKDKEFTEYRHGISVKEG